MRRPGPDSVFGPRLRGLTSGIFGVVFLVAFEAMAVATAMPVAVKDLDGLPLYGWAFSAFLVTSLFSTVVAGEVSDARGPRLPLLGGIAAFSVGLFVAGLAPSMPVFVVGRALQGLGAGGVVVALYVVVGRAYPETQRPQMFALMSAGWVLPSLVGPTVAGALADHVSWRWVFLGVPVLVLPAVALVAPWLGRLEGGHGESGQRGRKRAALGDGGRRRAAAVRRHPARLGLDPARAASPWRCWSRPSRGCCRPATLRLARGLPTAVAMRGFLAAAFFGAETFLPAGPDQRTRSVHDAGRAVPHRRRARLGRAGRSCRADPGSSGRAGSWSGPGCVCVGDRDRRAEPATLLPSVPVVVAGLGWVVGGFGMGMAMASVSVVTLELSPTGDQGVNSAALQVSDGLFSTVAIVVGLDDLRGRAHGRRGGLPGCSP